MIQKFSEKRKIGKKVSKWSNSKSYHVKSEIWRPSKKTCKWSHLLTLKSFSAENPKKLFLSETFLNGPIRKVSILKVKFDDLRKKFVSEVTWDLVIFRPKIAERSKYSHFTEATVWCYVAMKPSGNHQNKVVWPVKWPKSPLKVKFVTQKEVTLILISFVGYLEMTKMVKKVQVMKSSNDWTS